MSDRLRLILFDVDGTLVDSQGSIVAAMSGAFDELGLPVPDRAQILSIVGLSLPEAMQLLAPELPATRHAQLVKAYKHIFYINRTTPGAALSPLYPGARMALDTLQSVPNFLLGVATGKSARGLNGLIQAHDLNGIFVTRQVADHHPSKPHPSMIDAAREETGVAPEDTVMIGDTQFDMDMARAAGVRAIGVDWGYHTLQNAHRDYSLVRSFDELHSEISRIWDLV